MAFIFECPLQEEGGIKFMPFSLAEEREIGHFDAEGNFVEDKVSAVISFIDRVEFSLSLKTLTLDPQTLNQVRDKDKDAWLDDVEVVSDKV